MVFTLIDLAFLGALCGFAVTDKRNPDFNMGNPRYFLIYLALVFCVASLLFAVY